MKNPFDAALQDLFRIRSCGCLSSSTDPEQGICVVELVDTVSDEIDGGENVVVRHHDAGGHEETGLESHRTAILFDGDPADRSSTEQSSFQIGNIGSLGFTYLLRSLQLAVASRKFIMFRF